MIRRPWAVFLLLGTVLFGGFAAAGEDAPAICRCHEVRACWHWLKSPNRPPDDPCSCERCEGVARHTGQDPWPDSWRDNRFQDRGARLDAFLRRHAASWGLACSVCDRIRLPSISEPERYPFRLDSGRRWNPGTAETIRKQAAIEREHLGGAIVIRTTRFYLVSDVPKIKIQCLVQQRRRELKLREVDAHELAHITAERLEKGYAEFVDAFGPPRLKRPVGVFLIHSTEAAQRIQAAYLGHPDTTILVGGSARTISKGYCMCGFSVALHAQKHPSIPTNNPIPVKLRGGRKTAPPGHWIALRLQDDDQVHLRLRHLLGHTLMAAWPIVRVQPESLRPWIYVGAGHWLARRHRRLTDLASFCGEECKPLRDKGRKWLEKIRKIAADARRVPADEIFALNTIPEINRLDLHQRVWSWFEVFLEHDRERFVAFLRAVREEEDASVALRRTMGMTPARFDRTWADHVLGRRRAREDGEPPDAPGELRPGRRAVAAVRRAEEPGRKASLVKNLSSEALREGLSDLLPLLGHPSAHVRETTVLRLARDDDAAVGQALRTDGLAVGHDLALANVIRVLGLREDAEAADGIRARLGHASCAIASLDAHVAGVGTLVAAELGSRAWPVQVAAARALGALGRMSTVEDLLACMERSSGRVREECYEALKRVTRDDLGRSPEHWRKWWNREKQRAGGIPAQPPAPVRRDDPDRPTTTRDDGDDPTYYGIRVFSDRVGYVLDISKSMTTTFRPTADLQRRLRRAAAARPRIEFARDELIESVRSLDPRASFRLWTFHDVVTAWKPTPTVASATGKARAIAFIQRLALGEATNYYDAFRTVFGLPEKGSPRDRFRSTPDTVFFLTDGQPTVGEITETEELLSWFREENRFAMLRCHVIAFGDKNLDFRFLTTLARETGGDFVHLKED
jgi:hypothetical protein